MKDLSKTILIVVGLSVLTAAAVYYFGWFRSNKPEEQITQPKPPAPTGCLSSDEYADYPLDPKYSSAILEPKLPPVISVRDKNTKNEKFKFQIDDALSGGEPLGLRKCGVYAIRQVSAGVELWKYSYNGTGRKVLAFSENKNGAFVDHYSYDFTIDSQEKYLVLERSYLGKPDYALVIKDLKTMNEVLVWKLTDLIKQYSAGAAGNFGLGWWTEDDKYLLGDIYDGALNTAYYRIEAGTWKVIVYVSPPELLAGVERAMNYDNGYLAYVDIPTFTGIQEVADQLVEQARKEGRQKNLFLYNFATKQTAKIASIDPAKRFNIKWVSSSTLQYDIPSGATTTYTIPQ